MKMGYDSDSDSAETGYHHKGESLLSKAMKNKIKKNKTVSVPVPIVKKITVA